MYEKQALLLYTVWSNFRQITQNRHQQIFLGRKKIGDRKMKKNCYQWQKTGRKTFLQIFRSKTIEFS
jgi:hypothetical protein